VFISRRGLQAVFVLAAILWPALFVAAAWALAQAPPRSLTFRAASLVYVAGGAVCHQRADRSFSAWGAALPVCARCTGLYVGAAIGAASAWLLLRLGRRPSRAIPASRWRALLALASLPTVAALALEWSGAALVPAAARALAGLPLGGVAAWLVLATIAPALPSPGASVRAPGSS
jgi:uncharacterized membrane protein